MSYCVVQIFLNQIFVVIINLLKSVPVNYGNAIIIRVEAPITDHSRDYAPNLEKYKALQIFPCKKIEIRRIAKFW